MRCNELLECSVCKLANINVLKHKTPWNPFVNFATINVFFLNEAVPLLAMQTLRGRGNIAPTH
jgi:hypothetical protein